MEIKWLRLALKDLDDIAEYISIDNPNAARNLVKLLWEQTQILKNHPNIGRPGRVIDTRELVVDNTKYIIPYRVVNEQIQILRVLHASRKWPKVF
jgi:toxin ParE1/3/4